MNERRKRKQSSFGILFWIAIILFLIVLFLLFNPKIQNNMDTLPDFVFTSDDSNVVEEQPLSDIIDNRDEAVNTPVQNNANETSNIVLNSDTTQNDDPQPETPKQEPPKQEPEEPKEEPKKEETSNSNEPQYAKRRNAGLYYISLDSSGKPVAQKVVTSVGYNSSPLTRTIESLIEGSGLKAGMYNLIPEGTKLNKIWIKDGVAYIDLSKAVQFNTMGRAGHLAMLEQLVYTATEYATVKSVQLLIDGKKMTFLGSEGVKINEPLSRSDF